MPSFQAGWLAPSDDVNTLLPFRVRNPNFPDTPVTLHQLLTHTSSITDDGVLLGMLHPWCAAWYRVS